MSEKQKSSKKEVIVLGAGYGGITAALTMAKQNRILHSADITLIDRNDYHLVQTELHRVAAGSLSPGRICQPVKMLIKNSKIKFVQTEVTAVNPEQRFVVAGKKKFRYDYLVVSTGSETNYFGVPGAEKYALGLKTLEDALEIRERFEILMQNGLEKPQAPVIIVGAGATGVELAAYMRDQAAHINSDVPVLLIESAKTVLANGRYTRRVLNKTRKHLEKNGVEVLTGARMEQVRKNDVTISGDVKRKYSLIVWTAGVKASGVSSVLGNTESGGRLVVQQDLSLNRYPEIFVIGDAAFSKGGRHVLPCAAQYAIQQGEAAAENIARSARGKMTKRYVAEQKGEFISIGRGIAMGWMGIVEIWGHDAQFVKDSLLFKYLIELGPEAILKYIKM